MVHSTLRLRLFAIFLCALTEMFPTSDLSFKMIPAIQIETMKTNRKISVSVLCDNKKTRKNTEVGDGSEGSDNEFTIPIISFPQIDLSRDSQTITGNGLVTA